MALLARGSFTDVMVDAGSMANLFVACVYLSHFEAFFVHTGFVLGLSLLTQRTEGGKWGGGCALIQWTVGWAEG